MAHIFQRRVQTVGFDGGFDFELCPGNERVDELANGVTSGRQDHAQGRQVLQTDAFKRGEPGTWARDKNQFVLGQQRRLDAFMADGAGDNSKIQLARRNPVGQGAAIGLIQGQFDIGMDLGEPR